VYDLDERERAVLRELYLWRDGEARRRNRPPFKVLNDPTLVALAAARPRSSRDLPALRLNPYLIRRYGQALLAAVARGERASIPRPPRHPRRSDAVLDRYERLRVWRQDKATARGVAPDVVLSNAVLWGLAESNPVTLEELAQIEELGPWRRRAYGPEIVRLLHPRPTRK
jgi:ribonuclease D